MHKEDLAKSPLSVRLRQLRSRSREYSQVVSEAAPKPVNQKRRAYVTCPMSDGAAPMMLIRPGADRGTSKGGRHPSFSSTSRSTCSTLRSYLGAGAAHTCRTCRPGGN